MGVVKGLKNITEQVDKENAPYESSDRVKVDWLTVKDGEVWRMRFLQELDEDAPTYNEKAGLGFLAVEHSSPKNFKIRGLCTIDQGDCYACEQHNKDWKAGWKQKSKLYVNVLAQKLDDSGQPVGVEKVYVFSQGNGPKSVTPWLLEYAGDNGSITSQPFKLKRVGSGQKDTNWTLTPGKFDTETYDVTQHELFDLDSCVRDIEYDKQEAFYTGTVSNTKSGGEGESASYDADW